ncbi:Gfo/Idh/MocA family oxidoreductase [Paenibacillus sp. WQ 127069]|uniref:Gfo/Idh/MocA family oxidoreductase n=1 Tax=Paenibacillus baimaensis TaxID=2982185 RepID=A0ABT2UHZ7_9BACL|nr:Gfo/Idh/MocA family oxidoreductase [Paenibacillus sp. WQ 127069]MCU6794258.1 Gfo/Idh/MocA family oxidoreductase [Paenibacillus sp. WQ 127069]
MTLQVGFVGTGGFTRFHCNLLSKMEGVQVRAFCATRLEKAEQAAVDWNGAVGYDSLTHMLDQQKLDAVFVCVPPMAHGEIEYALIERGIPFLLEKPLGLDLLQPADIASRIQAKPLITSIGYHFRYMDSTQRALELLKSRTVGMALGYWMGSMPKVPWWRRQDGSGGQFIEQTSHMVDLLRYTMGEVEEVYAAYANRVMHEKEDGVTTPDVGTVTIKLVSGAVATISNTCILPGSGPIGLHVYTDQGVLELSDKSLKDIGRASVCEYANQNDPYIREHEAFFHAVRTGDTSRILSIYADSLRTQTVTTAALHSAASGLPVRLDEFSG